MTPRHAATALGLALALAACGHTEPFATEPSRLDGPLSATPPVQLTHAAGANLRPMISGDGRELTYSFVRGTPDRDRCLATLPVGGGTRTRTLCWTPLGHDTLADGIELGALAADGRLAFSRHTSRVNGIVANDAALYLAPPGITDPTAAEPILDLLTFRPEVGIGWDYLLDLAWTGADELTGLAVDIVMINICPPATCWDTTYTGLHVARINTATRPVQVAAHPVGPGAQGVAVDRSTGRTFVRYRQRIAELLPDGSEATLYTISNSTSVQGHELTGLAAAAGRVIVSARYTDVPPPPGQPSTVSELRRVDDGTAQVLALRIGGEGTFERLTLPSDGRAVIYEGRRGAARHLFRQELP